LVSLNLLRLTLSLAIWFRFYKRWILIIFGVIVILSCYWWGDVYRETTNQGFHFENIIDGLKIGMILFISSEVLFFVSFFWRYFHRRISPTFDVGQRWPPYSVIPFNPINVPLLNTIILLSSGITITWFHHEILKGNLKKSILALKLTILLGIYFTVLQGFEYIEGEFNISDSVYGSTFFIATGFHGLHVIIGSTFLLINLVQLIIIKNQCNHMVRFELAAWYWHFVDVVWLFLYVSIYWWGS